MNAKPPADALPSLGMDPTPVPSENVEEPLAEPALVSTTESVTTALLMRGGRKLVSNLTENCARDALNKVVHCGDDQSPP